MKPLFVGAIVFVCTFLGAQFGMWLSAALPKHHLDDQSKDSIRVGIGLIATMTALVLGLITASAKSSYDTVETEVRTTATEILTLDRLLARYGPETGAIRVTLKRSIEQRVDAIWPQASSPRAQVDPSASLSAPEALLEQIRALTPYNASQQAIQSRALELCETLLKVRWMVVAQANQSIPLPFLVILLFWLTITFTSIGLFAPKNTTVVAVQFVCALSISSALFLVLELNEPFDGLLKVSAEPMLYALAHINL
ncbi:bestrophin-like domain [Noviherbaspirillum pedocola]|uniref:DUF4239 domain-containing protein n=1 Tax=Noviherbaspirillum pedocola TaxID=2801341 RepID=A0A934W716_9BURK|nr:DUF4239 domain-containing protein [Noviherbaspirillum pedocola]MBK4734169.1 DUF4239 domain-containing protein [Noviherbaspirillum pedocola]